MHCTHLQKTNRPVAAETSSSSTRDANSMALRSIHKMYLPSEPCQLEPCRCLNNASDVSCVCQWCRCNNHQAFNRLPLHPRQCLFMSASAGHTFWFPKRCQCCYASRAGADTMRPLSAACAGGAGHTGFGIESGASSARVPL
eukprot:scaffold117425_cov23-Tisochrysis_lutea.AAC.1